METVKSIEVVKKNVSVPELLAGLAEECSELAQAALKLRRVYTQQNPTPITEEMAVERLYEEIADVELYLNVLDINRTHVNDNIDGKLQRWISRLDAHKSGDGA